MNWGTCNGSRAEHASNGTRSSDARIIRNDKLPQEEWVQGKGCVLGELPCR
jgi:hypothetical protein